MSFNTYNKEKNRQGAEKIPIAIAFFWKRILVFYCFFCIHVF